MNSHHMDQNYIEQVLKTMPKLRQSAENKAEQLNAILQYMDDKKLSVQRYHSIFNRHRLRRQVSYLIVSMLLLFGFATAIGFASSAMAEKLVNLPVIGNIFNLLGMHGFSDPAIERAVHKGFSIPIQKTATYNGITITLGNIYYDKNEVWLDLVESFTEDVKEKPKFIGIVQANGPGATIGLDVDINGNYMSPYLFQTYNLHKIQGDRYAATLWLGNQEFPETAELKIHLHRFGSMEGDWSFAPFTATRSKVEQGTREHHVESNKTSGPLMLGVTQVKVGPSNTEIEYTYTQPIGYSDIAVSGNLNGLFFQFYDENGDVLMDAPAGGEIPKPVSSGGNLTWTFHQNVRTQDPIPKSITVRPYYYPGFLGSIPEHTQVMNRRYFGGTNQEITVTKIERLPDKILIHVTTPNPNFNSLNLNRVYIQDIYVKDDEPTTVGEYQTFPDRMTVENEGKHAFVLEFPNPKRLSQYNDSYSFCGFANDLFNPNASKIDLSRKDEIAKIDAVRIHDLDITFPIQ